MMGFLKKSSGIPKRYLCFLVFCLVQISFAQYGGGTGEPNSPYLICDANHLFELGHDDPNWDKHFKVMADIDLSGYPTTSFSIIGYISDRYQKPFTGVFDGNCHSISNFDYVPSTSEWSAALFGYVSGSDAQIKNIGLIAPQIDAPTAKLCSGSLVGRLEDANVTGCWVKGGCIKGKDNVGGLIGYCNGGNISISYANVDVNGQDSIGGLVGRNEGYAEMVNCYSAGYVAGANNVGGLIGHHTFSVYAACFWDMQVNPTLNGIGNTEEPGGVIGETTGNMHMAVTYISRGWDFENIWDICEGNNYPKFFWQTPRADLVCPDGVDFIDYSILANEWYLEVLEHDFAPEDGDGIVNFKDWAVLVSNWDGVNYFELDEFLNHWLLRSANLADIEPLGGDDFVGELDLFKLSESWLMGVE